MRKLAVVAAIFAAVTYWIFSAKNKPDRLTAAQASAQFRQTVAEHYNGVVATGDFRGCVKVTAYRFSCAAYVRNHQNSLSSGRDVIGTVTVTASKVGVTAHQATGAEIRRWFARTGGN